LRTFLGCTKGIAEAFSICRKSSTVLILNSTGAPKTPIDSNSSRVGGDKSDTLFDQKLIQNISPPSLVSQNPGTLLNLTDDAFFNMLRPSTNPSNSPRTSPRPSQPPPQITSIPILASTTSQPSKSHPLELLDFTEPAPVPTFAPKVMISGLSSVAPLQYSINVVSPRNTQNNPVKISKTVQENFADFESLNSAMTFPTSQPTIISSPSFTPLQPLQPQSVSNSQPVVNNQSKATTVKKDPKASLNSLIDQNLFSLSLNKK